VNPGFDPAEYGTKWANALRTALLKAPSAVIRGESNYLLNPLHPDFGAMRFGVSATERIDPRLRKR
jgi:RES domain-containing protein